MTRQLITDQPFDLDALLNGTQDFRWRPWRDGWHSGVLDGNLVHVRQAARGVEYIAASDLDSLLISYFRLNDDLAAIRDDISRRDDNMARLVQEYPWLRILRQPDPWECTVSYICSATNNISRISMIVEEIATALGRRLELNGEVRHTFPTAEMVLEAGVGPLEELNLGLDRHSKIVAAAERVRDGRLDLRYLARPEVCYAEARRRLMECYGIGNKIADCIALFGLDKTEAFPVDRWVARAVAGYFPCGDQPAGDELAKWARRRFGDNAGYANQLLFFGQLHASRLTSSTAPDRSSAPAPRSPDTVSEPANPRR